MHLWINSQLISDGDNHIRKEKPMSIILHLAIEKVDQHSAFIHCEGILVSLLLHPLYSRLISHSLESCTGSLLFKNNNNSSNKTACLVVSWFTVSARITGPRVTALHSRMWELFDLIEAH